MMVLNSPSSTPRFLAALLLVAATMMIYGLINGSFNFLKINIGQRILFGKRAYSSGNYFRPMYLIRSPSISATS